MEQTTLSKQIKKRSTREFYFAIFCVVTLTFGSIVADFEAFELLYEFTRAHENWDLDEILLFLFYAGIVSTLYSIRRVGDIKRLNKKVTHLAYYDTVTQLPNRSFAIDQFKQMLRISKRKRTQVAVAFIDFDNFKTINDTFGHSQGDELLKQIGQRLSSELNDPGFVARLGGDEFLVLMEFSDHQALFQLDQLFSRASKRPYVLSSGEVSVTFSIGVALFPQDAATVPSLLKAADTAMYHTKISGKGDVTYYNAEMGEQSSKRHQLEIGLTTAIENQEFFLEYQPQKCLKTGRITGYEALLRWRKNGVLIQPLDFIPISEDTGQIEALGTWVLEQAIKEIKPILSSDQTLAINISPRQFHQGNLVAMVQQILTRYDFPSHQLELEVTESAIANNFDDTVTKVAQLNESGIAIAIDDFGTGYSSLARLSALAIGRIKIDKSFTAQLDDSDKDGKLICSIINIASSMKLTVIAEGVETQSQQDKLNALGCDCIQGYYFARPMTIDNLIQSQNPAIAATD